MKTYTLDQQDYDNLDNAVVALDLVIHLMKEKNLNAENATYLLEPIADRLEQIVCNCKPDIPPQVATQIGEMIVNGKQGHLPIEAALSILKKDSKRSKR